MDLLKKVHSAGYIVRRGGSEEDVIKAIQATEMLFCCREYILKWSRTNKAEIVELLNINSGLFLRHENVISFELV